MRNSEIGTELLRLEKEYWQAIQDKNVETALRLSDDPCLVIGPQGVAQISREEMKDMMQSANYTLNGFEIDDDVQVRLLGADIAILAYKVREDLTVDGKPVSLEAAESSTWVRRDGRWVCALHTESLVGDPFGRDRTAPSSITAAA